MVKDAVCLHCSETGHWKRNCPKFLEELENQKAGETSASGIYIIDLFSSSFNSWVLDISRGTHICTNVHGLKRSKQLERGGRDL